MRLHDNLDDNGKERSKVLFGDTEQRILSAALLQRIRGEAKGKKHIQPRLYLTLNTSADDKDIKDLFALAAMEMGEDVPDNLKMRHMIEVKLQMGDERHHELESIGREAGKNEQVVCAYLVSEMWHSRACQEEGCDPQDASDRELALAVVGMTLDGRITFQSAPVTHTPPNEEEMQVGESEFRDDMEFPLLEAYWRGYMKTLAEKLGITKRKQG